MSTLAGKWNETYTQEYRPTEPIEVSDLIQFLLSGSLSVPEFQLQPPHYSTPDLAAAKSYSDLAGHYTKYRCSPSTPDYISSMPLKTHENPINF